MLNFCLPEGTLKEIIINLEKKSQILQLELNQNNELIDKLLKLQSINFIEKNEIDLSLDKNNKKDNPKNKLN